MNREPCRYCRKPMANEQDCDHFQPGEGEHLCWKILQNCDQDAEEGIDLRDKEIARLEREIEQERQLADRLAKWLWNALECDREGDPIPAADIPPCREALADWRKSRNEPARFWVPGESCPDCGNDLSVRDHGDSRVYDGDECRCCECAFTGYLSVDEDGQTLVHEYQADEAVDPP